MKLNSQETDYLRQVLGVEAIFSAATDAVEVGDVPKARLAFVSSQSLQDRDRDLIEKMALAMGCSDYFSTNELSAEMITERGVGFVIQFGADARFEKIKVLNLPSLDQFFNETEPSELKKLKKATWDQLKKLKTEMDTRGR